MSGFRGKFRAGLVALSVGFYACGMMQEAIWAMLFSMALKP